MDEVIALPPGVAIAVIAFLLALLPAGLFIWLWYLRRTDRPVPLSTVAMVFLLGLGLVVPAFYLERWAQQAWQLLSPSTVHYFSATLLPLTSVTDVFLPALGALLIVATVEEGLRYVLLRVWVARSAAVDQVFDGLVLGVAAGLGFATLENTLYFLDLFEQGNFDTLVFVFFLRFLVSTLAHLSFGGIMGAFLARGTFSMYTPQRSRYLAKAFWIPWLTHDMFDLLLTLNNSAYAIILLLPGLLVLMAWSQRADFLVVNRKQGRLLVFEEPPQTRQTAVLGRLLQQFESPWNRNAPWLKERRRRSAIMKELVQT